MARAETTMAKSPDSGQNQAKLYADCLEKDYNQRPVIFYSNGYETYLWDDLTYPPVPSSVSCEKPSSNG